MHRESFPEFELDRITITVPYPGAAPQEAEQGIGQRVEEAVRSIEGIKKVTAMAWCVPKFERHPIGTLTFGDARGISFDHLYRSGY